MNRNKGIKATLVILVVVCLIQWGVISSLTSQVDELIWQLNDVRDQVNYQGTLIVDLQEYGVKERLADCSFDVYPIDWEKGTVTFKFTITPTNVSDNTRVVVNNTLDKVELERSGSSFVGTVDYPIDDKDYETSYHIYNGEVAEGSETIEWMGANMMAGKMAYTEFEGLMSYGNGKLTLAGNMAYMFNIDEKVKSSKIIFKDNVIDLGTSTEGFKEINVSEKVTSDAENNVSEIYIEYVTESGITYQVYPKLFIDTSYSLGEASDKTVYMRQDAAFIVTLEDGTVYHMRGNY